MPFSGKNQAGEHLGEEMHYNRTIQAAKMKFQSGFSVPVGGNQVWEGQRGAESFEANGRPGGELAAQGFVGNGVANGWNMGTKMPAWGPNGPSGLSEENGWKTPLFKIPNPGSQQLFGNEGGAAAPLGYFNYGPPGFPGSGNFPNWSRSTYETPSRSFNDGTPWFSGYGGNGPAGFRPGSSRFSPYDLSGRSFGRRGSYSPPSQPWDPSMSTGDFSFNKDDRRRVKSAPNYVGGPARSNDTYGRSFEQFPPRYDANGTTIMGSSSGSRPQSYPQFNAAQDRRQPASKLVSRLKEQIANGEIADEPYVPTSTRETPNCNYRATSRVKCFDGSSSSDSSGGGRWAQGRLQRPRSASSSLDTEVVRLLALALRERVTLSEDGTKRRHRSDTSDAFSTSSSLYVSGGASSYSGSDSGGNLRARRKNARGQEGPAPGRQERRVFTADDRERILGRLPDLIHILEDLAADGSEEAIEVMFHIQVGMMNSLLVSRWFFEHSREGSPGGAGGRKSKN